MARIRSLHPGQATDEDFVEMSRDARLFALHLRCEADDQGVFEWKPKRLKMAIFPADDDVDVDAILTELVANRQVRQFEVEGKRYGVIRNFRRWQRPKKPNSSHPLPAQFRTYAGLDGAEFGTGSELPVDNDASVPDQFSTGSEKPPQMEDVGCRREEKTLGASAPIDPASPDPFDVFWAIYPKRNGANPRKPAKAKFEKLVRDGADPDEIIAGARLLAAKHPTPTPYIPQASRWLNEERFRDSVPARPTTGVDDDRWLKRLAHARRTGNWSTTKWGPFPGHPGCVAPKSLLQPGDGDGWEDEGLKAASAPSRQPAAA